MAKTKTANKSGKESKKMANEYTSPQENPEQLYAAALTLVEQSQPDEALKKAKQLWQQVKGRGASEALPALNLLGEISVETGDIGAARGYFEHAVTLDPQGKIPETMGGGAEKFLWLAQLCEEGGKQSVSWFEKGAKALQAEISGLESSAPSGMNEEEVLVLRVEKKRKLANALCGIVEVYMTDLSWEDDAEARCENLITEALAVEDETSPEVLQTLASVRLSQERGDDARAALERSIEMWKDLDPEDPAVPDFPTRISLARILMEAELEREAMGVISRLIEEDDQSVEAWYLGGWCQFLISSRETEAHGEKDDGILNGSRRWLNKAIKLYELLDYEDERLLEHAQELVTGLDTVLAPEDETAEGGEVEWEGFGDDDEEDEEQESDAEMNDV